MNKRELITKIEALKKNAYQCKEETRNNKLLFQYHKGRFSSLQDIMSWLYQLEGD